VQAQGGKKESEMRVLLIGRDSFGKDCLKALLEQGEDIVGVITVPDRAGQAKPNPTKEFATEAAIPLLLPSNLKDPKVTDWVKSRLPELIVLAFVTDIIPKGIIDIPKYKAINYHPSLLPRYRGGSAINWAIINGETETGVTIHYIDAGIDTGDIIIQERVPIYPEDTVASLYFERLYPIGVRMIAETVRMIGEGKAPRIKQDNSLASYQPVIQEKHVIIDFGRSAQNVHNLIRGSNPNPGATTYLRGKKIKIWSSQIIIENFKQSRPGEILQIVPQGIIIASADGCIIAEKLQIEGGKKISAVDFVNATGIILGEIIG
jgi:methionyl-tRNA formyltransferase